MSAVLKREEKEKIEHRHKKKKRHLIKEGKEGKRGERQITRPSFLAGNRKKKEKGSPGSSPTACQQKDKGERRRICSKKKKGRPSIVPVV